VDDDRILAVQVKHADLHRRAVAGRADEHGQVIIHVDLLDGGADSVPDVGIVHPVLAGRRAAEDERDDDADAVPVRADAGLGRIPSR